MSLKIKIGDLVELTEIPQWLVHDLPINEQKEIRSFIGKKAIVQDIDDYGYYWIGFGATIDEIKLESQYSGHSFAITEDCLKKI